MVFVGANNTDDDDDDVDMILLLLLLLRPYLLLLLLLFFLWKAAAATNRNISKVLTTKRTPLFFCIAAVLPSDLFLCLSLLLPIILVVYFVNSPDYLFTFKSISGFYAYFLITIRPVDLLHHDP